MQKNRFFLLLFFFLQLAHADVAESNFRFAYTNIEKFIELCLNEPDARLSSPQRELLLNISHSLPLEKKNPKQLIFASEKETPGLFILNDQIKVAKTYDDIGSTIYINQDMIKNFNVMDALAILVHEFGHHFGIKDETELDLMGLKVAFIYRQKYLQEAFNENALGLKVSSYNYWLKSSVGSVIRMKEHFDILLSDEKHIENLSHNFRDFKCAKEIPKDIYCDQSPQIVASNVQNLTWTSPTTLKGNVTYICQCTDNSLKRAFSAKKKFDLSVQILNNSYLKNSATIRIHP